MKGRERRFFLKAAAGLAATLSGRAVATAEALPPSRAGQRIGSVQVAARQIAPPASLSAQARNYLAQMAAQPPDEVPPLEDKAAWKKYVAAQDAGFISAAEDVLKAPGVTLETRTMSGVTVYVASAVGPRKPHLFIHGGGWALFAGRPAMILTKLRAMMYGGVVYGVDYRTAPDHPFPAPLDDCLAVYREVLSLHAPHELLVSGESAGGNLAAALMHRARDAGHPTPGALFLNTPATDLTGASDSLNTNEFVDVLLNRRNNVRRCMGIYVGEADPTSPYVSPLFGDLSRGFPPTYLRTGTRDMLLSDTVRMHAALRRAGVEAELYVGEGMPHSGLGGRSPEDLQAQEDTVRWLARWWKA